MNTNQTLHEKLSEQDPDFVSQVQSIKKSTELYAMKKREVDPDRRELIQARIDNMYRKQF
ncbi:hypothetical protein [Leeuwenhoekiella marinoflava]|uniref:Uncharacterized protein n=2 Tax=Leeuwenhoekiella marinoflava TaxID=988 RepID=A0A4Q0PNF8_9FLAO|nr:hypothetical protein [Leeuwenhoekiella marinoflava]RXG32037.1 hypothetical protein DSL99_1342 [Leeuwenhoekiella marinoflava]SHE95777.1 hypothetical protein SAMN02745246_01397 [Leeuwenhoekiella marinoflava DSM 3653]